MSVTGQISVEQADDILHNCKQLKFFSFSPTWGHSDFWVDLLSNFKHDTFGDPVSFLYEEEELYWNVQLEKNLIILFMIKSVAKINNQNYTSMLYIANLFLFQYWWLLTIEM